MINSQEKLFEYIRQVTHFDSAFYNKSLDRWLIIAKPLGGLGYFEEMVSRICGVQKKLEPSIGKRALVVFCADNGVVNEGVSQTTSDVTAVVARNLCYGKTSACKMAQVADCDVYPVDAGINTSINEEKIIELCVKRGTEDFIKTSAMTREDACTLMVRGIELCSELCKKGYEIFCTGEMGIGNTTTSSACASVLLDLEPCKVTGKGAGLTDEGLLHKIHVIEQGIKLNRPDKNDALDVLSKVGGFDIAMMAGFFIGCALNKKCVVIDGFISAVSALIAYRLCPYAADYFFASHVSTEQASIMILNELNLKAPVKAEMHLGEGSGCMTLLPLLDMAIKVYCDMPTFDDIKIEAYKPL